MAKDNDDIWLKPPVNYTPWFKWLINKRQEQFQIKVRLVEERLRKHNDWFRDINFDMDLYLVEYNKEDGEIKSNLQRHKEGKPNRFYIDDIELMKLFD